MVFLIIFLFGRNTKAQERVLKSAYQFGTPELTTAQKLYGERKYEQALAAYQSILEKALKTSNWEEVVFTMEKKALTLRRLGMMDETIDIMNEAITLALNKLPKGHFLIAKMYSTRGIIDHRLGSFYTARSFLDTALTYYKSSNSYDSAAYARLIEYKFYAYQYSEGSQDTLLGSLEELVGLEKLAQLKSPRPDDMLIWLQSYPVIYIQKGDFEQALAYAIKGYKYANENRSNVSARYFAEAQYYLAQVLYYKKDFMRAIEIGNQAMPLVESTPREAMPEYYSFNNLMGIAYMATGSPEKALPYLMKALEIPTMGANDFEISNKKKFIAQVKINVGLCYNNLGQNTRGKKYLDESLSEMKALVKMPSSELHGNYRYLGDDYFVKEDWNKALVFYDSALRNGLISYSSDIRSFPNGDDVEFSYRDLITLTKKAASLEQVGLLSVVPEGLLDSAKLYVRKTRDVLLERRGDFLASEGKLFLSQNFKNLYETGIDISYEMYSRTGDKGHFSDALEFANGSKALLFLEQSQEFDLVNSNLLSQDIKERFFQSKATVEKLQSRFYEQIDNSATSDSVIVVNEQLLEARLEREKLKDSIKHLLSEFQEESELNKLIYGHKEIVLPKGKAFIEFFFGDDNIYVLGKSKELVSFEKVEITNLLIESLEGVVREVSEPPNILRHEDRLNSFQEQSAYIYDLLLKPTINKFKAGLKHLIIVPDEFLSRLPFQVLIEKRVSKPTGFDELNYLVKSYSIQYELSKELINTQGKNALASEGLLGIGFEQTDKSSNYLSLPGTEREIQHLEASVGGKYLIGSSGTKSEFLKLARNYDVLHLAIHGRADSTNNYESTLIFNGSEESNILSTNDLYLASLQARLAVLSACESGVGLINKGEGTFSIARGFSLVGVPSVVMSLWKVNDRVTSDMMVEMYQGFIERGESINSALRNSKLTYLEASDSYNAHPYYWAAFLQLGQDINFEESNDFSRITLIYIALLIVGVLGLVIFFNRKKKKG